MTKALSADPLLLTVLEVCERIRTSRATLYRWVATGNFPAPVKTGHKTRFYTTDVYAWLDKGRGVDPEPESCRRARAKSERQPVAA